MLYVIADFNKRGEQVGNWVFAYAKEGAQKPFGEIDYKKKWLIGMLMMLMNLLK